MNIKTKYILSIGCIVIFIFLYPYTREVPVFKSDDLTWSAFKNIKTVKEFDSESFSFMPVLSVPEKLEALNNKLIKIKGFVLLHKHGDEFKILLSEKLTGVCFMCNHDENYVSIEIIPKNKNSAVYDLKSEDFVNVKGRFIISEEKKHIKFSITEAELIEKLNIK